MNVKTRIGMDSVDLFAQKANHTRKRLVLGNQEIHYKYEEGWSIRQAAFILTFSNYSFLLPVIITSTFR